MEWSEIILTSVGAVVSIIVGILAAVLNKYFNIQIEANHRNALHSAVMTAVSALLARLGVKAADAVASPELTAKIVQAVHEVVPISVPEAKAALKPSAEMLNRLAESKLVLLSEASSNRVG